MSLRSFSKRPIQILHSLYKSYVIKAENNSDKLSKITAWFDSQSIQYGHPAARPAKGFDYQTQAVNTFNISAEDIVVNIYQPKGRFITTVFEPQSKLTDSATYDVTAWNLMYSYDLKAYAVNEKIAIAKPFQSKATTSENIPSKPYAYIFRYQSLKDVEFLGTLMQKKIKVRSVEKAFSVGGQSFDPGTLIVTRRNNESIADFDNSVQSIAKSFGRTSAYIPHCALNFAARYVAAHDSFALPDDPVRTRVGKRNRSSSAAKQDCERRRSAHAGARFERQRWSGDKR